MMGSWTGKILDRVFVVLGALVCLQLPLFMHQYEMQLTGHVAELQWQVDYMHEAAAHSRKSLDQYIQKFIDNMDRDISRQGEMMKMIHARWNKLSKALLMLRQSSVLTRPWVFFRYLQWDIIKSTKSSFEPGISFTGEGVSYAFLGMGIGYLFFRLLGVFWAIISPMKRKEKLIS